MPFTYTGKTALVTGASTGIGAVFARELAQRGCSLILTARSQERLAALADELQNTHKIPVRIYPADLRSPEAVNTLIQQVQQSGQPVDILVNNAGFSTCGWFHTIDPAQDAALIQVNIAALVALTHAFLPAMVARRSGLVINVASVLGFYPLPYQATYSASKAFVRSLTEALWAEYQGTGVRFFALCPGPTATEFFDRMGRDIRMQKMSPEAVVQFALRAIEGNQPWGIPGWQNR
ncbi:MAG: SDR family oxidoreductase, partial [Gloeomargarita sp. SKYG116]|nr:SDR family oxidoreductase [Gloeomargarita sp. SKYG116]MDW8402364.1 SDR family oxidoreductase [Gloeomargarita sp. SKYGB_i_bin116]